MERRIKSLQKQLAKAKAQLRRTRIRAPPPPARRRGGFKVRPRIHRDVRAIRKTLGPGFTRDKQELLSDYYDNNLVSKSSVTVEVFLYKACGGRTNKPCTTKFTVNLPKEVADHIQYKTKILFTSPLYEIYAQVITHILPKAGKDFFTISEQEPEFFILYHKGEVPAAVHASLATEPVANGRQSRRLPQHPNLNPNTLPLTEDRNCMPVYLVKTLEAAWAKDKTLKKTPLTIPLILDTLNRESAEMSFEDAIPFFRKHRLHVRVIDLGNHLLHEYDPATDQKVRHKTLNQLLFLHHNAHVVPLNHNLASFYRKDHEKPKCSFLIFRDNKTEIQTETNLLAASTTRRSAKFTTLAPTSAKPATAPSSTGF